MRGSSHAFIGGAAGMAVAYTQQADSMTAASLIGIGVLSGLVPDLDVNGKLSNTITSRKWIYGLLALIGVLLASDSAFTERGTEQWIGMIIGAGLIALPRIFMKKRTILLMTGIVVAGAGIVTNEIWIIMMGLYISAASRQPHRGITHSLIGLVYFGFIGYYLEQDLQVPGVFYACAAGYASHLIADLKVLPVNRKGVKWFQPFSKKEF
ncbi:metal-dependent hydrolase [Metabacillus sp. KIGAM252]|uniref:Metal-dependent hydrolase n=1 Tax=Metabacillus flavus TaxID=2823519 RepID=A0ABS5LCP1_9BACI|nr:metal-dependent hydrolase [Metabacillus flavus]MBS2968482.1 metal-dependent hydrolase [Metabacillus flavus]